MIRRIDCDLKNLLDQNLIGWGELNTTGNAYYVSEAEMSKKKIGL